MKNKIYSIDHIKKFLSKKKKRNNKIVLCHGVFDLLHIGHIKHFSESKSYGDILIVSVTCDKFVNKGPHRPAFEEEQRMEAIQALNMVDFVVLSKYPTATKIIEEIKPDIFCKGPDYKNHLDDITGEIKNEIKAIKKNNGKIVFTKDVTFSSSKLINKFVNIYPEKK